LNQFAPKSAQKNINLGDLRPLSTPLPSLSEQQAIAALLDAVDISVADEKKERNGLQLLKKSTADALLTVRVRVRVRAIEKGEAYK
jgi:restriction endonuclease S subunit